MNIKEYIASGILERYALGQCSASEIAGVENALQLYPELKHELTEIETALFKHATTQSTPPPLRVKENVMAHVMATSPQATQTKVVQMNHRKRIPNWLAAASIIGLAISTWMNFSLTQRNNTLDKEIASLRDQNSVMAGNLETTKVGLNNTEHVLAMVADASTRVIVLKDPVSSQKTMALAYWNPESKEVYIKSPALENPGEGFDYQLWAIVDGVPVDAGIVSVADTSSLPQQMHSFGNAQAFAITVEKKGGSATPTLEKMVAIGNV